MDLTVEEITVTGCVPLKHQIYGIDGSRGWVITDTKRGRFCTGSLEQFSKALKNLLLVTKKGQVE